MSNMAYLLKQTTMEVDRSLSDSWVTIGNSKGLASSIKPAISNEAVLKDDKNIKLRGIYNHPFSDDLDAEGYSPSISIETITPIKNTQNVGMLRRYDRVLVEHDGDDRDAVKIVYVITSVQPDGKWRSLIYLTPIGPIDPSSYEDNGISAFEYTFPFVFGGRTYNESASLDEGPEFVKPNDLSDTSKIPHNFIQ